MDVRTISSCPVDGTLSVKAVTKTIYSIKSNAAPSIGESLAVLFNENTIAKVIGTAEIYLENNVRYPKSFDSTSLIIDSNILESSNEVSRDGPPKWPE